MPRIRTHSEIDPLPVSFEQLRTFASLARWGKQSAVESDLGKSQSQISRDLTALERALGGVMLLDRTTRTVTAAGEALLDYATNVLAGWQRVSARVSGSVAGVGQVALIADHEVMAGVLIPILGSMRERLPDLRVQLASGTSVDAVRSLRSGEADVALFADVENKKGIAARPFVQGEVAIAVPATSSLAGRTRIRLSMLKKTTLLLPPKGSSLRAAVDSWLQGAGLGRAQMSDVGPGREAALAAVAAGLGAAFVVRFERALDPLFRQVPRGVSLRPAGRECKPIRYVLAIRKGHPPGGPTSVLIRELLRITRQR